VARTEGLTHVLIQRGQGGGVGFEGLICCSCGIPAVDHEFTEQRHAGDFCRQVVTSHARHSRPGLRVTPGLGQFAQPLGQ
jgi:hypothetical protein